MFSDEELREAVSRGAQFLDERMPLWFVDVDVDTLQLDNWTQCVLGQLVHQLEEGANYKTVVNTFYGDGDPGGAVLAKFGLSAPLTVTEARNLGFTLRAYESDGFGCLTETWMREIGCRRERYLTQ